MDLSRRKGRRVVVTDRFELARPVVPINQGSQTDTEARSTLLRGGRVKWCLVRVFDLFWRPVVSCRRLLEAVKREERPSEIRTILVLEYWGLGDAVILLPFLQNLRRSFPSAHITLLVNPKTVGLLQGEHLCDELIPLRVPWAQHFLRRRKYNPFSRLWIDFVRVLHRLRRRHFDLAMSGRMDIRDNFFIWLVGARERVGYGIGGGGQFLTEVVAPDALRPHRSQLWLHLLEHMRKPVIEAEAHLSLGTSERAAAAAFLAANGIGPGDLILGVHAMARNQTRNWGKSNFAEVEARLASRYRLKPIWFVDPNGAVPRGACPQGAVLAALPLRQFMAVLERCQLLICNDGGPMHIATALGVPVLAVFGPTEAAWYGPMGGRDRIVAQPGVPCRPCFDYCIWDQPYCLRTILVEDVHSVAVSMIGALGVTLIPQTPRPSRGERSLRGAK